MTLSGEPTRDNTEPALSLANAEPAGSPPSGWLYGFSVAHVQRYLLSTSRLREIQGGSEILEALCGGDFERALVAAGLSPESILSRAAAGARVSSSDLPALRRLYAAWPRIAEERAPGVLIQQALVEVSEAGGMAAAQRRLGERLRASRVAPLCVLPAAGPLIERSPRSGKPAEAFERISGQGAERVDGATHRKVEAWRELQRRGRDGSSALDQRCLGADLAGRCCFVRGREAMAEGLASEPNPYVGVIHADGNAVGRFIEVLLRPVDDGVPPAQRFAQFSGALSTATRRAVESAIREVLVPAPAERSAGDDELRVLRARPIVLGGDDLTFIVAAPLAFPFARRFLEAFETTTGEELARLGLPAFRGLTACAGLALVKASFPFDRAHTLAESLCRHAKKLAREAGSSEMPSALAFHRVTSSLPEDAETVYDSELGGQGTRLTFEAYRVGSRPGSDLASFASLRQLASHLDALPRGSLRELSTELRRSPARADEAFSRMIEVSRRRLRTSGNLEAVLGALGRLTGSRGGLWRESARDDLRRTPILDAQVLLAAERGGL